MTLQCKSRFRKSVIPETVRNVLRKYKYHGRVPQRKSYVSKANRQVSAFSSSKSSYDVFWRTINRSRNRFSVAEGMVTLLKMPRTLALATFGGHRNLGFTVTQDHIWSWKSWGDLAGRAGEQTH
ncbi:hypothetical protein TNCV_1404791 [Trichonephila clavipes]|nr:hypothetical protein TNCV_1404791 [Trichonephila clavipes]